MIVQHNITSMNANRQLGIVGNNLAKSTEKLSSGYKINRKNNTFQRRTISKCFLIYFSNTNGKFYILQFFASVKYSFLNRNNPCFNYNVCKTFASFKCTLPDRINPLFYLYFFQRSTSIKSPSSYSERFVSLYNHRLQICTS